MLLNTPMSFEHERQIEQDCIKYLAWTEEDVTRTDHHNMLNVLDAYHKKKHTELKKHNQQTYRENRVAVTPCKQTSHERKQKDRHIEYNPLTHPHTMQIKQESRMVVNSEPTTPSTPRTHTSHDHTLFSDTLLGSEQHMITGITTLLQKLSILYQRISIQQKLDTSKLDQVDVQSLTTSIQQEKDTYHGIQNDIRTSRSKLNIKIEQLENILGMYKELSRVSNVKEWNDKQDQKNIQRTSDRILCLRRVVENIKNTLDRSSLSED